ncbi:repetitive proline-rich cell wall protein 2 [Trichonephila clavipes]|nr:repetitive proline-rich cell wall protein 2 [Trichonephila clavipes]
MHCNMLLGRAKSDLVSSTKSPPTNGCLFSFVKTIGIIKKTWLDNSKRAVMEAKHVNEFRPNDVMWEKTSKGFLRNADRLLKNTDKRMVYIYNNIFFAKKDFTFGLRTVKSGEIHLIQTTHVPMLIYELPASSLKCRAHPNVIRRSFEPHDQMLYHRTILEPHTAYPIPAGTNYIVLTVKKTAFGLDIIPESLLPQLLQKGIHVGDFRKMKKFNQTPYKLPPPTPIHVPAEKRPLEENAPPKKRVRITPVMRRVSRRSELPMAPVQIPQPPVKIPDILEPPVQIPDILEPPVQIPDILEPPVQIPDILEPPVQIPDILEPPVQIPDILEPPVQIPDILEPPVQIPDILEPPVQIPDILEPPVQIPDILEPPVQIPDVLEPPVQIPDVLEPPVQIPDILEPPVQIPDVLEPPVQIPDVLEPPVQIPDVLEPPVQIPDVLEPPVQIPDVLEPPVQIPDVLEPPVQIPDVLEPPVQIPDVL